jgi:LCP family protein required for cell wall assembly
MLATKQAKANNNSIQPSSQDVIEKPKNSWLVRISRFFALLLILVSLVCFGASAFIGIQLVNQKPEINGVESDLSLFDFVPAAANAFLNRKPLKGQNEGRTNVLLIGLDPDVGLSDTIIIGSFFYKDNKLATVNIPRDFQVYTPDTGYEKINAIYPLIKRLKPNDKLYAGNYLANFVSKEFNLPIHYWAAINVNGLRQAVDLVGGIEVNVEKSFTDNEFPTDGYTGYMKPAPTFKQGLQKMNGLQASIYARSRHSPDPTEGSDFARSYRQSIVIQALLKKIKEQNIWENFSKINDYLSVLGQNLITSATVEEMINSGLVGKNVDISRNYYKGNWQTDNGFLCSPPQGSLGYTVGYGDSLNCGTYFGGQSQSNPYRKLASDYVQDLLNKAVETELQRSSIVLLSNKSTAAAQIEQELTKDGWGVISDNAFKGLISGTGTSTNNANTSINASTSSKTSTNGGRTKVEVFIQSGRTKDLVNEKKLDYNTFEYTIIDSLPDQIRNNIKPTINLDKAIVVIVK